MERKPPSSIGDFLAILKRRKYWIIVPFVVVTALGVVLGHFVPRTYQSTTTIMVVPQKVPTAYVRPSTSDVENRLNRIGLEVMNGTGFSRIINSLDLYPELRKKASTAQVVAAMRKDISVSVAPDATDHQGNVGAFTISYIGPTPQKTQQATKQIADLFVAENTREGHQRAQGTDAFLSTQVTEAAQQLAAEQAKVQAFKDAHLGSLPEQAQANLGLIAQYQAALQSNSTAIDQASQQRVYLESVLNVTPNGNQESSAPVALTPLQIELSQKQAELHADLLKYTPEHPDVIRLQHDIAALKSQIKLAPKSAASAAFSAVTQANGPSQTDLLRGQLAGLNTEIKARSARQREIEQKISQLQNSMAVVPAVQTEFSSLDSQYQEMQKNYNTLVEKQQEAKMAAQLDENNDSEQFMILQPANLPFKPYRPDPTLLHMGVVLIALLIGFMCGAFAELRDDTIHDADEAAAYLKLPVIVALPKSPPFSDEGWKIAAAKGKTA